MKTQFGLFVLLCTALLAAEVGAQSDTAFTYQGQLNDVIGNRHCRVSNNKKRKRTAEILIKTTSTKLEETKMKHKQKLTSVSILTFAPFVDAISTGTFIPEANINHDRVVNLLDICPVVDLLSG